ncbi:hypothetical protein TUMEXPCC7403_18510 [Tumidithrix helvetica PCC 7403]|uniref:hypothetical protein n=1 Tax=Tumidithrix helvetica TaxID=3457545 RepID=UPI003CA7DC97
MMLTHPKTLRAVIPQRLAQKDFGSYLQACRLRFHFIKASAETQTRAIAWSSGTLLLLVTILPNGSKAIARIYCKDTETCTKTLTKLNSGNLLAVKLGFQLGRSFWSVIPQI